jgi:hypothetical protein
VHVRGLTERVEGPRMTSDEEWWPTELRRGQGDMARSNGERSELGKVGEAVASFEDHVSDLRANGDALEEHDHGGDNDTWARHMRAWEWAPRQGISGGARVVHIDQKRGREGRGLARINSIKSSWPWRCGDAHAEGRRAMSHPDFRAPRPGREHNHQGARTKSHTYDESWHRIECHILLYNRSSIQNKYLHYKETTVQQPKVDWETTA